MKIPVFPFYLAPLFLGASAFAAPAQAPTAAPTNRQLLDAPDEPRVGGQLQLAKSTTMPNKPLCLDQEHANIFTQRVGQRNDGFASGGR